MVFRLQDDGILKFSNSVNSNSFVDSQIQISFRDSFEFLKCYYPRVIVPLLFIHSLFARSLFRLQEYMG